LQEFTSEIKSQKSRLDNAITQFQQQFSKAEENRREEFLKSERLKTEKLTQITEEQKETIKEIIGKFETENEAKTTALSKKSEELLSNFKQTSDNLINSINGRTNSLVNNIESNKDEAEKLVHVIANTGMAGGYQKVANQARKTKNYWHFITIISLIGLITFAIIAFMTTVQTEFNFGKFGARTFVAFAFGILAAYSARQAEKNSEVERVNRQLELELASIDPYLSKLPEEKQIEVKRVLAEKWFGNMKTYDKVENKLTEKYSGNMLNLLKLVLDNITKK